MPDALAALQSVLIGPDDSEIVVLEAALRTAQLAADVEALTVTGTVTVTVTGTVTVTSRTSSAAQRITAAVPPR